jgi:hypothetical protein
MTTAARRPFPAVILLLGVSACAAHIATATNDSVHASAQAICAYYRNCDAVALYRRAADVDGCTTAYEAEARRLLGLPGVVVTAASLSACALALDSNACNEKLLPQCVEPLAGTLVLGTQCSDSLQCASGICDTGRHGSSTDLANGCGTCAAPQPPPPGWKCLSDLECGHGRCHAGKCVALAVDGGACDTDADCSAGRYCAARTCIKPLGIGADCRSTSILCDRHLLCDGSTHTCQPWGAIGAVCTSATECDRERGAACDPLAQKCVAVGVNLASAGAACSVGSSVDALVPCGRGALCMGSGKTPGVCVVPADVGERCGDNLGLCKPGLKCWGRECFADLVCK